MKLNIKNLQAITLSTMTCLALTACSSEETNTNEPGISSTPEIALSEQSMSCSADGNLEYLCGLYNSEDLLGLGSTGMILASGMSSGEIEAHLYLINPNDNSFEDLLSSTNFNLDFQEEKYPNCPSPLNKAEFSPHGLSLNEFANKQFDLYMTSHGEREAIEMFTLDLSGANPVLNWHGCAPLEATAFSNSVAILSDGGFVTTKMMDTTSGFGGEPSGLVFEWHPGGDVFIVEGTELDGANGIAVSEDERYMYVAAFGSREIIKFDRSTNPISKQTISVDIVPDNIRWGDEGKLLTAGNNYVSPDVCSGPQCGSGWSILEIDAETMAVRRVGGADQEASLQGVSTALLMEDEFWVGTFNGDRVGRLPR